MTDQNLDIKSEKNVEKREGDIRCPNCFALNPPGTRVCAKCKATLPLPAEGGPLRKSVKFCQIVLLFSDSRPLYDVEGLLVDVETDFRIYKAYREPKQSPFIIYDPNGFVSTKKLEYALVKVDEEALANLIKTVPREVWQGLRKEYFFGTTKGNEGEEDHPAVKIWRSGFLVTPVSRLKSVEFLRDMDWRGYVEGILAFKGVQVDPRLKLVRLTHLMRGLRQSINPHALIVLPGQTGKSDWYYYVGTCETKVTANSLIGYADAEGPKPGSVHGSELPFALDQIESSGMFTIFRYMLGLMETGEAIVDVAAHPFRVYSLSPFAIISNPIGDPKSDFGLILEKLTKNPTAGRRFGIILYDKEAVRIPRREKDIEQLREHVQLFRAVEEYALPELRKIINDEKVWEWLNEKNEELIKQAIEIVKQVESEDLNLYLFLKEFVENGGAHTRGGALRAAMAMNLDRIALREYDIDDLLMEAEDYLHDLLNINYRSIKLIVASYQETREQTALRLFDTLPIYLKEIVSAVELWRRSLADNERKALSTPFSLYLSTLNYVPKRAKYFSEVLKDAKKSNPEKYNEELREHFGFEVKRDEHGPMAIVYDLTPRSFLEPLGTLGKLGKLGVSKGSAQGIESDEEAKAEALIQEPSLPQEPSQNSRREEFPSPSSQNSQTSQPTLIQNGLSRSLEQVEQEALTAETCELWMTDKCKAAVPTAIFPHHRCPSYCPAYKPKEDLSKPRELGEGEAR